ncbi:hypothetical protein [Pseudarthrobacter sp. N5]|uniref:hypothetical protein n=1 Tax=Pseudarthrobacter sp. N5 TaxID=3418416 RepID=UPI003CF2F039
MEINDTLGVHDGIRYMVKSKGEKRPYIEARSGADLFEDTGEFREITQVVDRRNGRYIKRVVGTDGEIVKDVDLPLRHHDGGSAQRRQPSAADSAATDDQDNNPAGQ